MRRLEEKFGHAFCAPAKHAIDVTDGVPVADEGFSSCSIWREVREFMEHLGEITICRAGSRANGRDVRAVLFSARQNADMVSAATQLASSGAGCYWTSACLVA